MINYIIIDILINIIYYIYINALNSSNRKWSCDWLKTFSSLKFTCLDKCVLLAIVFKFNRLVVLSNRFLLIGFLTEFC